MKKNKITYAKPAFFSINSSGQTYSAVPTNDFDLAVVFV